MSKRKQSETKALSLQYQPTLRSSLSLGNDPVSRQNSSSSSSSISNLLPSLPSNPQNMWNTKIPTCSEVVDGTPRGCPRRRTETDTNTDEERSHDDPVFSRDTIEYQNFLFALDIIHDFIFYNRLEHTHTVGDAIDEYKRKINVKTGVVGATGEDLNKLSILLRTFEGFFVDYISYTERYIVSTMMVLPYLEKFTLPIDDILSCIPTSAELYSRDMDKGKDRFNNSENILKKKIRILNGAISNRLKFFYGHKRYSNNVLDYLFVGILMQMCTMPTTSYINVTRGLGDCYEHFKENFYQGLDVIIWDKMVHMWSELLSTHNNIEASSRYDFFNDFKLDQYESNWLHIIISSTIMKSLNALIGNHVHHVFLLCMLFCSVVCNMWGERIKYTPYDTIKLPVFNVKILNELTPKNQPNSDKTPGNYWIEYVKKFKGYLGYYGYFFQSVLNVPAKMNFVLSLLDSIVYVEQVKMYPAIMDNIDIGDSEIHIGFKTSLRVGKLITAATHIKNMDPMEAFLALLKGYENYTGMRNDKIKFINFSRFDYIRYVVENSTGEDLVPIDKTICEPMITIHNMPLGHITKKLCYKLHRGDEIHGASKVRGSTFSTSSTQKDIDLWATVEWRRNSCRRSQIYDAQSICVKRQGVGNELFFVHAQGGFGEGKSEAIPYIYAELLPQVIGESHDDYVHDPKIKVITCVTKDGPYYVVLKETTGDWERNPNMSIHYVSNILGHYENVFSNMKASAGKVALFLKSFNMKTLGDYLQVLDAYRSHMIYHTTDSFSTFTAIPLLYHGRGDFYLTVQSVHRRIKGNSCKTEEEKASIEIQLENKRIKNVTSILRIREVDIDPLYLEVEDIPMDNKAEDVIMEVDRKDDAIIERAVLEDENGEGTNEKNGEMSSGERIIEGKIVITTRENWLISKNGYGEIFKAYNVSLKSAYYDSFLNQSHVKHSIDGEYVKSRDFSSVISRSSMIRAIEREYDVTNITCRRERDLLDKVTNVLNGSDSTIKYKGLKYNIPFIINQANESPILTRRSPRLSEKRGRDEEVSQPKLKRSRTTSS